MAVGSSGSIGVFDSGSGGLTVYRALRESMPSENFVYLADTARLPYGTKSSETVASYGMQAVRFLMDKNIKLLVVACNTASALALPTLKKRIPSLPCFGVIEPGAIGAAKASAHGRIAVLATESTVQSGAYEAAIRRHKPFAHVRMLACNLLVSLVEEGWCEGPEAEGVLRRYLVELGTPGVDYDTLVLGCTHFPLLAYSIRKLIGPDIPIVDSAMTTASAVKQHLKEARFENPQTGPAKSLFIVTDSAERFSLLAARFVPGETFVPGNNVFHASLGSPVVASMGENATRTIASGT